LGAVAVAHECALVEAFEEFGCVLVDFNASGVEEFLARPTSGSDANGPDTCFAGG
jgi:hypothetical protein